MRYRCEILNHGIDGYEVTGVTRGALGLSMTPAYNYSNACLELFQQDFNARHWRTLQAICAYEHL